MVSQLAHRLARKGKGLHYWLGFEYMLILAFVRVEPGQRWLDVGTGAWSVFPYLLAHLTGVEVVALDVDGSLVRQHQRRSRAEAAGLIRPGDVHLVRADAQELPFGDDRFDGVTAISTLETR